jgi:hypothetical protein
MVGAGVASETERAQGRRRDGPAPEVSEAGGGETEGTVEGGNRNSTSLSLPAMRSEKVGEGLAVGAGPGESPGNLGCKVVLRGETTTTGTETETGAGGKDPPTV